MKLVISESNGYKKDYIRKMYGESKKRLREQDVEIEVKHEGILEVPEGKNVDNLPVSHFVNLAKKKGLSKITKALNNLQVWNKKKNPSLSKWAGDMIDKVSKKMEKNEALTKLKEDSLDDLIRPEIKKRYIWPLYEDSAYEISEIIEKYQNTNRFKNEIKSFDLKEISYMDWPALQLEIECSNEAYVLIRKNIEREGLYVDDDEFDESLKLKESGMYDYYDTPDNEYATFMGDTIPNGKPDKIYKHKLTVPESIIEEFAEFVAGYFNEDFNDIVNNESNNVWMDDFDSENKYINIMCSDDEFDDIENWVNEKSLRTKNESYPRYKEYYWKYRLDHPFIDRIEDSETAIFTDSNIRNIPLLACENPDDCYSNNPLYWAVEDADYNGNPLYCTEDKAYKRLKDYLNMKIYERRHDL